MQSGTEQPDLCMAMAKRLAIFFVLAATCGILASAPAGAAPEGLLEPVESLLPAPLPSPDALIDKITDEGKEKGAGLTGGTPDLGQTEGGAQAGSSVSSGTSAGTVSAPQNPALPKTVTDEAINNGVPSSVVRVPQWPVAADTQPIAGSFGTLASNAASLARPLSIPMGLGVAAIAALVLATRRPRRLAKVEDEGTWGHGGRTWRL